MQSAFSEFKCNTPGNWITTQPKMGTWSCGQLTRGACTCAWCMVKVNHFSQDLLDRLVQRKRTAPCSSCTSPSCSCLPCAPTFAVLNRHGTYIVVPPTGVVSQQSRRNISIAIATKQHAEFGLPRAAFQIQGWECTQDDILNSTNI